MQQINMTIYQQQAVKVTREITNVVRDLPTWMFRDAHQYKCPVCHQELDMLIAHGVKIETCDYIEMDNYWCTPIHSECLKTLSQVQ